MVVLTLPTTLLSADELARAEEIEARANGSAPRGQEAQLTIMPLRHTKVSTLTIHTF